MENSFSKIEIHELWNNYIPNIKNHVFRVFLRVSEDCNVSIRLETSYRNVKIHMKISCNSKIFRKIDGKFVIFIPIVNLVSNQEYFIDTFVEQNSWPLTEDEWSVVEDRKKAFEIENLENYLAGEESVEDFPENPWWKLQVLCDPKISVEVKIAINFYFPFRN